jgi:hypothetical protein
MDVRSILSDLEQELGNWRTRFDEMRVKANLAKMEARDRLEPVQREFEAAYDRAKKKLGEVAETGGEELSALRRGLVAGWDELRRTYRDAPRK